MSHYHPNGFYAAMMGKLHHHTCITKQSPNGQLEPETEAKAFFPNPRNHMMPKYKPELEAGKKVPVLKATQTPRPDNVTIEKAAKYPIAQKAFLAARRPSQQALPDLSVTVQELEEAEPEEEEETTPVSTPPPVLVRQVAKAPARAPTPPKRPGTRLVAKK